MTVATRLLAASRGGGSFSPPPVATSLVGLMNAAPTSAYVYSIGPVTSSDAATLTPGAAAVIAAGSGWESSYVKDPTLVWDGTQLVCYYAGFDGTTLKIGRATASTIAGTWTKYGSNPVISNGAGGSPDEDGAEFPYVLHEPAASPPWKMWYTGYPNGATPGSPNGLTVCYADSTDGLSWTKRGTVISLGTAGQFDDVGMLSGCALKVGSLWYVFYTGYRSDFKMHSAYATCTDPADSGTYTKGGAITGFTGNLTVSGVTWQSNLPRTVVRVPGGGFRVTGTVWNPTPSDTEEASFSVAASSLTSWDVPTVLAFPLTGWYANSGENPAMIPTP
jgi:hypothetical protein